ncbi:hypothetical protein C8R43DRAFT_951989 [Mycena crocata]|nr:hypothetical protein C8R43DRAFT_951989 [Mycena crocata]
MSKKKRNPRPHRSARSSASRDLRKEEYMKPDGVHALGQKKIESITKVIKPTAFPMEFVSCSKNAKKVRKTVGKLDTFDGAIRNLRKITEDDNDIVLIPSPALKPEQAACFGPTGMPKYTLKKMHPETKASLESLGPPPYLGIRYSQVVSPSVQNKLWAAWKLLVALGVRFPPAELARSSSPALHFGVWELYKLLPIITATVAVGPLQCTRYNVYRDGPAQGHIAMCTFLLRKEPSPGGSAPRHHQSHLFSHRG